MFSWRVTIPSLQGSFTISLDHGILADRLASSHTVGNLNNVKAACLAWLSLLGDSPLGAKPNSCLYRFFRDICTDYRMTVRNTSSLADRLLRSLERAPDGTLFISEYIPEFQRLPIFGEYLEFGRTGSPLLLQYILSFLWFSKKGYYEDSEFETTALRRWRQTEEELGNIIVPPWVSNLKKVLSWIFRDWKGGPFLPKHGSGSVAERAVHGVIAKNRILSMTPAQLYLAKKAGYSLAEGCDSSEHVSFVNQVPNSLRTSCLMFVPKDYKTDRAICMEPTGFMYTQQAVRLWLESYLEDSVLKRHIVLKDQTHNQRASSFGSATGLVDTIDLSSASDCVLWDLIRSGFPTQLVRYLSATRTSTVALPDGTVASVKKYAPMGSSLCFPIQSVLFSAIVLMVTFAQGYGRRWDDASALAELDLDLAYQSLFSSKFDSASDKYQPFLAYGDDIVLDHRTTSSVIECLIKLGFKVNTGKSFMGDSAFRESCGEFYLLGKTVTPYFLKLDKIDRVMCVETLSGLIDHANKAYDHGYLHLRRFLINVGLRYSTEFRVSNGYNPILFSSDRNESLAFYTPRPRNAHLKVRRWKFGMSPMLTGTNVSYQRDEYRRVTIRQAKKVVSPDIREPKLPNEKKGKLVYGEFDDYYYNTWWRSRYSSASHSEASSHLEEPSRLRHVHFGLNDSYYYEPGSGSLYYEPTTLARSLRDASFSSGTAKVDTLGTGWSWGWTPSS